MKADKLLSSLCYFSVFFAPFLFPIIIYFLASGDVKHHAGKSLWIHFVPYLSSFIGFGTGILLADTGNQTIRLIIMCIFIAIGVYYFILNFVRGISVLIEN